MQHLIRLRLHLPLSRRPAMRKCTGKGVSNTMTYKTVKDEALGKLCRKCINQKYEARLRRQDCQYWIFPAYCKCCGRLKNIVMDIALFSRWKLWKLKK